MGLSFKYLILIIFVLHFDVVISLAGGPIRAAKLPQLLDLVEQSNGGVITSFNIEIVNLMESIASEQKGNPIKKLSGNWKLIYTTEKEINFFYTWPFAKPELISQRVDTKMNTLENLISFKGGGSFCVCGIIDSFDANKCIFEFKSATIQAWNNEFTIPPVGKGYFETIYCNDKYRLSRDSRGDYSISEKLKN